MKEQNLLPLRPVICTPDNYIIDGQHRFVSAEELGLPVSYCVTDAGPEVIQRLNQNGKPWTVADFLHMFCVKGKADYKVFADFQLKWNLGIGETMMLLSGKRNRKYRMFKDGIFKVSNVVKGEKLASMFYDMEKYYPEFKRRAFFVGFIRLASTEGYDHKRLMARLAEGKKKITHCIRSEDYLQCLAEIYNWKHKEKIHFR